MVIIELISHNFHHNFSKRHKNLKFELCFFGCFHNFLRSLLKCVTKESFLQLIWIMKRPADAMEPTLPTRHVLLKSEREVFVGKRF